MSGTLDLYELLEGMQPELDEGASYIFLTVPHDLAKRNTASIGEIVANHAIATFNEEEGLTVVVKSTFLQEHVLLAQEGGKLLGEDLKSFWKAFAEKEELPLMGHITMRIHSSLSAVGFTAAFSRALTETGISCNVFAGYYHDHLFVPAAAQSKAMTVLTALTKKSNKAQ
ncbi:acetyltransferase [Leptomonas pyrrhocoris]|uniref:Acetyltransferase n=1 Tax=Leptomonas pyrrhocoris TaxID=157538 RepID=A0A0N0DXG2_LEPPY|nr:acetyltransferase [Leptomonas pyrrhocoris]KPA82948.1 acetyltransferase [Leptomonas pyrrhocoris]|eukprot:XP_015661387.1 acetyltransferase [Leptomonas pyrrhocoris]